MRFGLFIPQGWRLDLVGIAPQDQWQVMRDLAAHADAGPWDSLWVYDHFHTVPMPTAEATHEAWTLMAAYASYRWVELPFLKIRHHAQGTHAGWFSRHPMLTLALAAATLVFLTGIANLTVHLALPLK